MISSIPNLDFVKNTLSYKKQPLISVPKFDCNQNQNSLMNFEQSASLRTKMLLNSQKSSICFTRKISEDINAPYLKGIEKFSVGEIDVFPFKKGEMISYLLKSKDKVFGKISISENHPIKLRVSETAASHGKSGKMVFIEFPEGVVGIIPLGGKFKADGIKVDLSGKHVSKGVELSFKHRQDKVSFKGNFVVTTGYRANVVRCLVNRYWKKNLYKKVNRPPALKHKDIDVVELTAGLGNRMAGITWISKVNKPGIQLPYKDGYLMYNHIDNLFYSGIIDEKTKVILMNDPQKTGAANHILLAHKNGHISGQNPVLVCSSDQIHDIDFDKAIKFYKKLLAQSKKNPQKPLPLAIVISVPVKDYSGLGVISINNNNIIRKFTEKPKTLQEAGYALIKGKNGKSTGTYRANTGIYILSPEFITIVEKYASEFKNKNTDTLDFGNDTLPRLKDLCEKGETIIDGKIIKEDLRGMALYNYNAKGHWADMGGCIQDVIDISLDMAKGTYKLPEIILNDMQSNVDVFKKVIYTPEAKKQLDLIMKTNSYGKISASNMIFLTKDNNIKRKIK